MVRMMRFLIPVCLAYALILPGCHTAPAMEYQILTLHGISWAGNLSTSYVSFGATTESGEPGKISLPVSDGDLLYLFKDDGTLLYLRYSREEGTLMDVSIDTSKVTYAYVNGSLAYFELSDQRDALEKFKELMPNITRGG